MKTYAIHSAKPVPHTDPRGRDVAKFEVIVWDGQETEVLDVFYNHDNNDLVVHGAPMGLTQRERDWLYADVATELTEAFA